MLLQKENCVILSFMLVDLALAADFSSVFHSLRQKCIILFCTGQLMNLGLNICRRTVLHCLSWWLLFVSTWKISLPGLTEPGQFLETECVLYHVVLLKLIVLCPSASLVSGKEMLKQLNRPNVYQRWKEDLCSNSRHSSFSPWLSGQHRELTWTWP